MFCSEFTGSQENATQNLASEDDQPAEQKVLLPFSKVLYVDTKLKFSKNYLKESIYYFFKDKNITALSQLTTTPAFPTPHVLAQFAQKAYRDCKTGETDAEYETRLELPDGWKLLTTASNTDLANGYFGAAYWHPEHQHVVIAHRGVNPNKFGAIYTDVKGVLFKHHVPQLGSASTFAHKVVEVLQNVNEEKGTNFQLFFTGHGLGGWLAQITTFTTEYLKTEGNIFLKSNNDAQSYHPHTVVFDSPGCKDMLSQMADEFDVLYQGRSIDIQHLDITSYLSAPNRINTCNKHLGTVYRIFVDLSDMSEKEKSGALYNLATHSIDRIVKAFDPETGQVYRDEENRLKIAIVIDWPAGAGLQRGKDYKRFFKWANHLNDYHPQITDETFKITGYHPLRYQTTKYDDGVSSLRIFSQEERQFLERYFWLRELPEFFKPEEIFSVIENKQAQEQAEKILQTFQIGNDKIRCTCASALPTLIPYVKRLLQLFHQLTESTKKPLSPRDIRKKVYQIETRRYIERMEQSPLDFDPSDLSLREFIRSDQQQVMQVQMKNGDEWTGIIKVYQLLQKNSCLCEGQYTILKLKRSLQVNQLVDFSTLMQSTETQHLLLMACENIQLLSDETKETVRTLFNAIKQKPSIKIILTTRSEGTVVTFLQEVGRETFGERFVTRDDQITWSDLIPSSQEKLLGKTVSFQGTEISLNNLLSPDSPLTNLLPLGALLEQKHLEIAEPVPISDAYDKGYYIDRTLHHQIYVKENIFSDKEKQIFRDLLASTEQEFQQLCQGNPEQNVHWLLKDKSGKSVWHKSQGSLENLREYIDTQSSCTYTNSDLDRFLEQAQRQRVMIISDTAGMGKSTVLTHLSKQIKQRFPAKWVVRIDLNDYTDALMSLGKEQIDKEEAIEFVSEKLLKLKPGLEMELFKQCCEQKQKVRIVIMLDGFDEISPNYKDTVFALLQTLRQTEVEQLWVTTRPHLRKELEEKLQQFSYTLRPFSV